MHRPVAQSSILPAVAAALAVLLPVAALAQSSDAPRTPWGDPDLGGVWDYWTFTPLERPEELADRATLTVEEAAVVAQEANAAALARDLAAPPGDPAGTVRQSGRTGRGRRR